MRKTETITIVDGGENKTFVVTAMSAMQQERFLIRAGVALAGTGILSVDTDASGADVMETLGQGGLKMLGQT